MQEESFNGWCDKLFEILDAKVFTREQDAHIDNCGICMYYLADDFYITRIAQFKILGLSDQKAQEILDLLDEDTDTQIVV